MNPLTLATLSSIIYLGWSKLCENVGAPEPLAWTLQKTSDGVYYVGKAAGKAAVNVTKAAANKLNENMAKAKAADTAEAKHADVIDVKATPAEK